MAAAEPAEDSPRTSLMLVGDFEQGKLDQFGDSQLEETLRKVAIVTTPVRHGEHALKMTLERKADSGTKGHRTDFWVNGLYKSFSMHEDYWYGFSTYLPEAWQPDTQAELFAQWVGWRDYGPSLAIYIYGDSYVVRKRWGKDGDSYTNLWRGNVSTDRGNWVDWVFHVRWSDAEDGFVDVWKNGQKIVSDKGRNCAAAEFADYFKFGIYKWPWKQSAEQTPSTVTRRVIYIDEIRIGDGSASYGVVAPPGRPPP